MFDTRLAIIILMISTSEMCIYYIGWFLLIRVSTQVYFLKLRQTSREYFRVPQRQSPVALEIWY